MLCFQTFRTKQGELGRQRVYLVQGVEVMQQQATSHNLCVLAPVTTRQHTEKTNLNILLSRDFPKSSEEPLLRCAFAARGSVAIFPDISGGKPEDNIEFLMSSSRAHQADIFGTASQAGSRLHHTCRPCFPTENESLVRQERSKFSSLPILLTTVLAG